LGLLEHFWRAGGDNKIDYNSVPLMISERSYWLACRAEVTVLRKQGLSWPKVARAFNARALPLPKPGKGKRSGPKLRALMEQDFAL
jgi:hypothetical protein